MLTGLLLATVIAMVARRAGSLSTSGAFAAAVLGTATFAAGEPGGRLLVVYFVASASLSRFRHAAKERLSGAIVGKSGARDAVQVMANGAVFAVCMVLTVSSPLSPVPLAAAAAGALAASSADTWATEIGTLWGGAPRSVRSLRSVPAGTSGAMSAAGSLAMVGGAIFVAAAAALLGVTRAVACVAAAGIAGALADTMLGATLQERRWCSACNTGTERNIHDCGTVASHAGGIEGIDNDVINFFATLVGAAVASLCALSS